MRVVIFTFLAAIFLGPYGFLIHEKLHLIRIIPPLVIFIFLNANVKIIKPGQGFILFYLLYIGYTILISLIHFDYIKVNDILNLAVLLLYVIAIIILISHSKELFINKLTQMCWLFIMVCIPIAISELLSWQHLPLSGMADNLRPDYSYFHLPTVFYTNPNDFAFIFVLTTMFLLSKEKRNWMIYLLTIITFLVIYVTEARLVFIVFFVFIFFYFDFFKRWTSLLGISLVLALIGTVYFWGELNLSQLLQFEYSEGSSIFRRYHLYMGGLQSIFYNYGTGFGVGGYHHYYSQVLTSWWVSTDTDPHNFYIELLINSGLYIAIFYILFNVGILLEMIRLKAKKIFIVQFILYHLLLLSSSSSLFLWPHYLFYFVYVYYAVEKKS